MLRLMITAAAVSVMASPVAAQTASIARGHDLVLRNCGMCHAIAAEGPSPNPEAPPFRDLHHRYPIDNLGEALAEGILTGHPQMPEFRFDAAEVQDVIAYLKSVQTRQGANAGPEPRNAAL